MDDEAEQFWERLYGNRRAWGGRPNPLLVETAEPLSPGAALDLGCGAGGDTGWLAQRGWQVTAVDISRTAWSVTRGVDGSALTTRTSPRPTSRRKKGRATLESRTRRSSRSSVVVERTPVVMRSRSVVST